MQQGKDLWITFEDWQHVGVFTSEQAATELNEKRRRAKGVEPVTIHYVPASKLDGHLAENTELIRCLQEWKEIARGYQSKLHSAEGQIASLEGQLKGTQEAAASYLHRLGKCELLLARAYVAEDFQSEQEVAEYFTEHGLDPHDLAAVERAVNLWNG